MNSTLATPEDVRFAYRIILGREPDEDGFKALCNFVHSNSLTPRELGDYVLNSPERRMFASRQSASRQEDREPVSSTGRLLTSCACKQSDLESESFRKWVLQLRERQGHMHRKIWEWCFISQALNERGMLKKGSRGLGFAVGKEPLASLFASFGCEILGTDLDYENAKNEGWVDGNQHADGLDHLNTRQLCDPVEFLRRVKFRVVDMRDIPSDIGVYDFLWSSCAMEHLGGLDEGRRFVINAMRNLRPGGVAVHTTEFNCHSDTQTIAIGNNVLYRKQDLLSLQEELEHAGHECLPIDFFMGTNDADRNVDEPPYKGEVHLKLRIGEYVSTSFGLIIRAGAA